MTYKCRCGAGDYEDAEEESASDSRPRIPQVRTMYGPPGTSSTAATPPMPVIGGVPYDHQDIGYTADYHHHHHNHHQLPPVYPPAPPGSEHHVQLHQLPPVQIQIPPEFVAAVPQSKRRR